jgi:hypothetical protein
MVNIKKTKYFMGLILLAAFIMLGSFTSKAQADLIINDNYSSNSYGKYWDFGRSSINDAVKLDNGNIILVGASGKWVIQSMGGTTERSGTWVYGNENITQVAQFDNGSILLAAYSGRWQIIDVLGNSLYSGTWSGSTNSSNINTITKLSNGNVLMAGENGYCEVINSNGASVSSGIWTTVSFTPTTSKTLSNGNIFLGGSAGNWQIIDSSGNKIANGVTSNAKDIYCSEQLSNGNIIFGGSGSYYSIITQSGANVCEKRHTTSSGFLIYEFIEMEDNNIYMLVVDVHSWNSYPYVLDSSGDNATPLRTIRGVIANGAISLNGNDMFIYSEQGTISTTPLDRKVITKTWPLGSLTLQNAVELNNGNIMIFSNSQSAEWQVIDRNGNNVNNGILANNTVYTASKLNNGNVFVAGNSKWSIINTSGAVLYSGTSSTNIRTSCSLSSGEILFAGDNGAWTIISPTGTAVRSGVWVHGAYCLINASLQLLDGNIMLAGNDGNWQIITPNGANAGSGTGLYMGRNIRDVAQNSNGQVLLLTQISGGGYAVMDLQGSVDYFDYNVSSAFSSVSALNNNRFIAVGNDGYWFLGNSSPQEYGSWDNGAIDAYKVITLSDGNIFICGEYGKYQITNISSGGLSFSETTPTSTRITIDTSQNDVITEYKIERSNSSDFSSNLVTVKDWQNSFDIVDTGLSPNTTYYYRITARRGIIETTPVVASKTTLAVADASLTFGTITNNSIVVNINKGTNPDGTEVYVQRATNQAFTKGVTTCLNWSNASSFTDTQLSPSTVYYYRIRARNSDSILTTYSIAYTSPITCPSSALNLTCTESVAQWHPTEGRIKVVLNWTKPDNSVTGYHVEVFDGYTWRQFAVSGGNTLSWDSSVAKIYPDEITINSYATNTRTANIFNEIKGGLDLRDSPINLYRSARPSTYNNTNYYMFRVRACNSSGSGPWVAINSDPISAVDPEPLVINATCDNPKIIGTAVTFTVSAESSGSGLKSILVSAQSDMSGNEEYNWNTPGQKTGSQQITHELGYITGASTLYIKAKTISGVISENVYRLQILRVDDITPPTVQVVINAGESVTKNANVSMVVNANDDFSAVSDMKMRYSLDGTTWTSWEAFEFNRDVTLSPSTPPNTPEVRRIFVQVKDASDNIGNGYGSIIFAKAVDARSLAIEQASINDLTAPEISISTADGRSAIRSGNSVPIIIKAKDNVTPLEDLEVSIDKGATWQAYEPFFNIKVSGSGMKTIYVLVRDQAGNESLDYVQLFVL